MTVKAPVKSAPSLAGHDRPVRLRYAGTCCAPRETNMQIRPDDLSDPAIHALLEEHLQDMHAQSPRESVHALDLDGLRHPSISFWSAWDGATLLGCAALRQLDPCHGEIKSMRTPRALRWRGAGRALLAQAQARGYTVLSLETGAQPGFAAARALYAQAGFMPCGPFGNYQDDPNSVFMRRPLPAPIDAMAAPVHGGTTPLAAAASGTSTS